MKKLIAMLLCLAMMLGLASCGGPDDSTTPDDSAENTTASQTGNGSDSSQDAFPENPTEVYTINLGTVTEVNTAIGQTCEKIKEELYERSNGAIVLDVFYSSTLGGTTELAEGLLLGTVDIAVLNAATLSNYCSNIDVLNLPYVFSNRENAIAAMDEYFDEITDGIDETLGTPLGIWELGWRQFCNTQHPVTKLEDFQGLTVRVQEGALYFDTFNALGCIPTNIAIGELVTAMQQGVCDAHENPLATVVNQRHYEFAKYLTMTNHIFGTSLPILSDAVRESLPESHLNLLLEVFDEYRWYSCEVGEELDNQFLATLEENGMEVAELSDSELTRIRDAVSGVWESYDNQELLNNILAMQ